MSDDQTTISTSNGVVVVSVLGGIFFMLTIVVLGLLLAGSFERNSFLLDELDNSRSATMDCEHERYEEAELQHQLGPAPGGRWCYLVKRTRLAEMLSCETGP